MLAKGRRQNGTKLGCHQVAYLRNIWIYTKHLGFDIKDAFQPVMQRTVEKVGENEALLKRSDFDKKEMPTPSSKKFLLPFFPLMWIRNFILCTRLPFLSYFPF